MTDLAPFCPPGQYLKPLHSMKSFQLMYNFCWKIISSLGGDSIQPLKTAWQLSKRCSLFSVNTRASSFIQTYPCLLSLFVRAAVWLWGHMMSVTEIWRMADRGLVSSKRFPNLILMSFSDTPECRLLFKPFGVRMEKVTSVWHYRWNRYITVGLAVLWKFFWGVVVMWKMWFMPFLEQK